MTEAIISHRAAGWERLRYFAYLAKKNPLFLIGAAVVMLLIIAALFAPWITPFPGDAKYAIHFAAKLKPPSMEHFFGTDALGRDIFTRVVFGARMTIRIGVTVLAIALALGVPLGLVAGYFGGRLDDIIMRISDIFLSFPSLLLPLAIAAALGPSITEELSE